MILTGPRIKEEIENGNILIEPYEESRINPNSYNLSLNEKLLVYSDDCLDMAKHNTCEEIIIPEEGFELQPGVLYLGRTNERTATSKYAPMLEGRSSIGRLGMSIHVTAGFGDTGFDGFWTLEITVVKPLRIYPNVEICQIYYHEVVGDVMNYKPTAKYNNNEDVQPSKLYQEFSDERL